MNEQKWASVLIVDQQLEHKGVMTNAAFVLGLTAGRALPESTFGPDVTDGEGGVHRYLTRIGHMVRKVGQSKLRSLREAFAARPEVLFVDYPEDAAPADYEQYAQSLAGRPKQEINYRALHVYGPEEIVLPLTKNLSRLE